MASGKNTRQKQLDQQAASSQQQFNSAANTQLQAGPVEDELNKQNLAVLQYKGDYKDLPGTSWASGQVAKLKDERATQNRGAYTFGSRYADPNLLAALGSQEEGRAAEADQLGFEGAVENRLAGARGEGANLSALRASRIGSVLGPSAGMAQGFSQQATQFASQPGFWSQALLGAIGAGGQLGSAFLGRPHA